jgi:DNA mismatch repair protein MSH2
MVEYDRLQRDICKNAMSVACTYVPVLERASLIVAEIDVLASLAAVAALSPNGYCRPIMTDGEEDGLGIEVRSSNDTFCIYPFTNIALDVLIAMC